MRKEDITILTLRKMDTLFGLILESYYALPDGTLPDDLEIDTLCDMSRNTIKAVLGDMSDNAIRTSHD